MNAGSGRQSEYLDSICKVGSTNGGMLIVVRVQSITFGAFTYWIRNKSELNSLVLLKLNASQISFIKFYADFNPFSV